MDACDATVARAGAIKVFGDLTMRIARFRFMRLLAFRAALLPCMLVPALAAQAGAGATPDASQATGITHTVGNCNDSGPGSLRAAVAMAQSGDRVDMTGLACRRIVLTGGAIAIPQDDLTLFGKNPTLLAIDGNDDSQVFVHAGSGTLRLLRLTVTKGRATGPKASGGCIRGDGHVELHEARVLDCSAQASGATPANNTSSGGGIYAARNLKLFDSRIEGNSATFTGAVGSGDAFGGGVLAGGRLTAYRSRILDNHSASYAGGAYARAITARYADIRGNQADQSIGGIGIGGGYAPFPLSFISHSAIIGNRAAVYYGGANLARSVTTLANSTISGNVSGAHALYIGYGWQGGPSTIANSTITLNQHTRNDLYCSALLWDGGPLNLESSIVSGNLCHGEPGSDINVDYRLTPSLQGENNLVGSSTVPLPPDTIVTTDPGLLPLASNGGPTQTHAPVANSPAIDAGNNTAGLAYDQRGEGYPRTKAAKTDIGAYER